MSVPAARWGIIILLRGGSELRAKESGMDNFFLPTIIKFLPYYCGPSSFFILVIVSATDIYPQHVLIYVAFLNMVVVSSSCGQLIDARMYIHSGDIDYTCYVVFIFS